MPFSERIPGRKPRTPLADAVALTRAPHRGESLKPVLLGSILDFGDPHAVQDLSQEEEPMTSSSERTPSQLLKIREVSKMVQVSRSTLYVMINRGHFPGPVRILLRGVR